MAANKSIKIESIIPVLAILVEYGTHLVQTYRTINPYDNGFMDLFMGVGGLLI